MERPSSHASRSKESDEVRRAKLPTVIDVQALLAGRTEVRLLHLGEEYRLRITKQGKLILTK